MMRKIPAVISLEIILEIILESCPCPVNHVEGFWSDCHTFLFYIISYLVDRNNIEFYTLNYEYYLIVYIEKV